MAVTKTQNFYGVNLLNVFTIGSGQFEMEFMYNGESVTRRTRKNSHILGADLMKASKIYNATVDLVVDGRGSVIFFSYVEKKMDEEVFTTFDPSTVPAPPVGKVHEYPEAGYVVMTAQDWNNVRAAVASYLYETPPAPGVAVHLRAMSSQQFTMVEVN